MFFKTILLPILLVVAALCSVTAQQIPIRKARTHNIFFDLLHQTPQLCTGCPQHYCDADPGLILGYCCGCRRAFDILPIFCGPNIQCPLSIRDVCHDYEYMLNCCC